MRPRLADAERRTETRSDPQPGPGDGRRAFAARYRPRESRRRIDVLLAERGLAGSRTSAAESVRAGRVRIGVDGPFASKPSDLVAEDAELIPSEPQRLVSRGGIKQGVRVPLAADDEHEGERQVKALTRAELAIFLAALPEKWRLLYEFLAHTGPRISEAVGLTWAHVELGERARLLVREQLYEGERKRLKSGKGRRDVSLSAGMAARLLADRRDTFAGPESPVFASRVGTPLRPSNIARQTLRPTRDAVGLPWVTFHTFRHTCASLLFEEERNVKQVQEWLGHADPAFTLRRYVHLMDAGVGDADFLDDAVSADPARIRSASR